VQAEAELRHARYWILGVGAMMFVVDLIVMSAVWHYIDHAVVAIDGAIFAVFIGLFFGAKHKPVVCCVLALVIYWALQVWVMVQNPEALAQGIVMKIFFTMGLIRGIKAGSRAQDLRAELDRVFG
jgi:hypothetical protein